MVPVSVSRQLIPTVFAFVEWDSKNPLNVVHGGRHRMAVDTQKLTMQLNPDYGLLNNPRMQLILAQCADRLGAELRNRISRMGSSQVPLTREGAMYVIDKLRGTQPKSKIMKLRKVADSIPWSLLSERGFKCVKKSNTLIFIKRETYPSGDKPPRLISFPQEGEKLIMTMAFYHVMHPLFSSKYATKEIPEDIRPKAIEKRLQRPGARYFVADYTSWECVPNRQIMQLGEHRVLRQCVDPAYHFVFDWIEKGGSLLHKSGVRMKIPAVQYSGRYTTSLSNTIRNKLMMDSVATFLGVDYAGVFEGDDSLTSWPHSVDKEQISDALGRLGVVAELDEIERPGKGGYCSMYWNDDNELVIEPVKLLSNFPISRSQLSLSSKNHRELLSAKAMSLAYRAPGCPISCALVDTYIQPSGLLDNHNQWVRERFHVFTKTVRQGHITTGNSVKVVFDRWDLVRPPTDNQRHMFHELFHLPPHVQIQIENKIREGRGFDIGMLFLLSPAMYRIGLNPYELMRNYWFMRNYRTAVARRP